jgi:hypothetical protein
LFEVTFESESKLKEIGNETFIYSGLKSIRIPNIVERIGNECFSESASINEVIFESETRLEEIGEKGFYRSGLESILIPNSVERIRDECFSCKSLCVVHLSRDLN